MESPATPSDETKPSESASGEPETSPMAAVPPEPVVVWPEDPWENEGGTTATEAESEPKAPPAVTSPVIPTWPEAFGEPATPAGPVRAEPPAEEPATASFPTQPAIPAWPEKKPERSVTGKTEPPASRADAAKTVPPVSRAGDAMKTAPPTPTADAAKTVPPTPTADAAKTVPPTPRSEEAFKMVPPTPRTEEALKTAPPEPPAEEAIKTAPPTPRAERVKTAPPKSRDEEAFKTLPPTPRAEEALKPEPPSAGTSTSPFLEVEAGASAGPVEAEEPASRTPTVPPTPASAPGVEPGPPPKEPESLATAPEKELHETQAPAEVVSTPETAPSQPAGGANPPVPSWAPKLGDVSEPQPASAQWPSTSLPAWAPQRVRSPSSTSAPWGVAPHPAGSAPPATGQTAPAATPPAPAPPAPVSPAPAAAAKVQPAAPPAKPPTKPPPGQPSGAPAATPAGQATPTASWEVVEQEVAPPPAHAGPTPEDRSYAEWFAWAKRSGAPAAACHAAAQGAFRALAAGNDMGVAVKWATLAMASPPGLVGQSRQLYCAWFSLGNIDLQLPTAQAHAFATGAVQALDQGADSMLAHQAGLAAAGITGG